MLKLTWLLSGLIAATLMLAPANYGSCHASDQPIIDPTVRGDLYLVRLRSDADARTMERLGLDAVLRTGNDIVVLVPSAVTELPEFLELTPQELEKSISRSELALDQGPAGRYRGAYTLIYEVDDIRLLRVDPSILKSAEDALGLVPIADRPVTIDFESEEPSPAIAMSPLYADLDSLAALIRQDSIQSYLNRLQAFNGRVATTSSNLASRDWIHGKFAAFGYDSIYNDNFSPSIFGGTPCYNVIATKLGTMYPDIHVIIGAHHDGVSGSPAADDNGTGTAAVLEMARVLHDVPTDVSIIFATFDAEEYGLYGSQHYATTAVAEGEQIMFVWNMDMIGHYTNTNRAKLYHGSKTRVAQQWIALAGPMVGITGTLSGNSSGSDHYPFTQRGFEAVFLHEYVFSTVYHSNRDSTTYVNTPYATKMIKASLATIYLVQQDIDNDGIPNDVDNCPLIANAAQTDSDADNVGDPCDNCVDVYNPLQSDADLDNLGDACDLCPGDTINDPDNDGVCGEVDPCPYDALDDADGDGFCGNIDKCPEIYNPGQDDADGDGLGDLCDACPSDPLNDIDGDGICGNLDNCPTAYNPSQADGDADGRADACDNCPTTPNPSQLDTDSDGWGNECDNCPYTPFTDRTDTDADGWGDLCDNCPTSSNPAQTDSDNDGFGDACDNCPSVPHGQLTDSDEDGVGEVCDNCPTTPNPGQEDGDQDGIGDACECACQCHCDPSECDGVQDVLDVIMTINVAFRGSSGVPDPAATCPYARTDLDCSAETDVIDVVKMVNVAFRGFSQATQFCDPCP